MQNCTAENFFNHIDPSKFYGLAEYVQDESMWLSWEGFPILCPPIDLPNAVLSETFESTNYDSLSFQINKCKNSTEI